MASMLHVVVGKGLLTCINRNHITGTNYGFIPHLWAQRSVEPDFLSRFADITQHHPARAGEAGESSDFNNYEKCVCVSMRVWVCVKWLSWAVKLSEWPFWGQSQLSFLMSPHRPFSTRQLSSRTPQKYLKPYKLKLSAIKHEKKSAKP